MDVVGTMFFKNNALLIDKPRKRPTYQMIGGRVEDRETPLQAAIRECHEELGNEAIFDDNLFELVMEFNEIDTWRVLQDLLVAAIPNFEFPRFSLDDYTINMVIKKHSEITDEDFVVGVVWNELENINTDEEEEEDV